MASSSMLGVLDRVPTGLAGNPHGKFAAGTGG